MTGAGQTWEGEVTMPLVAPVSVDSVIGVDLLDRLAATDRIHATLGLEVGAVSWALAHRWEPVSGAVPRLRG